jgi:YggT family protein
MIIDWIIRIINLTFGVVGLLLLLRIILLWFNVPSRKPVSLLFRITDPLLQPIRRHLSGSAYPIYGSGYVDMAALLALLLVFLIRPVLVSLILFVAYPQAWLARLSNIEWVLISLVRLLIMLFNLAMLIRIILSWFSLSYRSSPLQSLLYKFTEPVLAPIRRHIPPLMGIDFSPMIALFLISLVGRVVTTFISWIF